MSNQDITAVILAGGRGQRMGGRNKGLIELDGQALIKHVLQRLQPQLNKIIISANDQLDDYAKFGYPVIPDKIPGFAGPLVGMYSAMTEMSTDWLITLPCDTPKIPLDYVAHMYSTIKDTKVVVAHDGTRQQSGFCLIHKSLQEELLTAIKNEQLAVYKFLKTHHAVKANFADVKPCFVNINTPEQLSELELHAN